MGSRQRFPIMQSQCTTSVHTVGASIDRHYCILLQPFTKGVAHQHAVMYPTPPSDQIPHPNHYQRLWILILFFSIDVPLCNVLPLCHHYCMLQRYKFSCLGVIGSCHFMNFWALNLWSHMPSACCLHFHAEAECSSIKE